MLRRLLLIATLVAPIAVARAQCPNGSPPPCRSAPLAASRQPRAIDPNRIAVLPFRVTTSDSLLGEGFAELLATEFADDQGPRAVDMATVISAWRRAGGGLRTPLPRDRALALARELGAGLLTEGSIVGLGRNITVTTNIVSSANGSARGSATRVSASADSIDSALRQTASGLVAALGGQQKSLEGARFTESPEAMRFYLHGLTAWRGGRQLEAQTAFERAMSLDTTFAQAAFRRHLTNAWGLPPGLIPGNEVTRRAWALRARLSPAERTLLEAHVGGRYPAATPMSERVAAQDRAAQLQPDSPDALFLAGDMLYHYGSSIDSVRFDRAREYFELASAIDSAANPLRHLIEIAVRTRDVPALRRLLHALERTEDSGRWAALMVGWTIVGDEAQVARFRSRPQIDTASAGAQWALFLGLYADVPAARLDDVMRLWNEAYRGTSIYHGLYAPFGIILAGRGRPVEAERAWAQATGGKDVNTDRARLMFELVDMGAGLDVEGAVNRLSQNTPELRGLGASCEMALLRFKRGIATASDSSMRLTNTCGRALDIVRIPLDRGDSTIRTLEAADNATRNGLAGTRGYEAWFLSRAWERVGRYRQAARALTYRSPGNFTSEATWLYGEEARLALAAGDTTWAIRALENYLPIIQDAEPPYAAKRDSLRALLATLKPR